MRLRIEQRRELDDKCAEIYNHLTGDLLTENPDVANSNFGTGRKIGYLYKGMTPEEREDIRKEQLKQILENKVMCSSISEFISWYKVCGSDISHPNLLFTV